jgi:hypothetical protein
MDQDREKNRRRIMAFPLAAPLSFGLQCNLLKLCGLLQR